ncbi:MAG: hypothetical protein GY822_28605 [Deltaproteobacteria bacterium]|nr:hypothetical protein [Deltaproteobacteria bacterium]
METWPVTGQPFVAVRTRSSAQAVGKGVSFVFLNDNMTAEFIPVDTPDLNSILDSTDSTMWGDFDIDCARASALSTYGECTLVGTAHNGAVDTATNKLGSFFATTIYQTTRWRLIGGRIVPSYPINGDAPISWSNRYGIAGIGGVTMIPNTSGYELVVSANRIIRGGSSNSYLFRYDDNGNIENASRTTAYDIDVGSCDSAPTTVGTIYGRTQHGGADLAWCEDCNTTASFKMYRNSDGFCF